MAFDLKAVIDEKEELTNERDAYKCKAHRLNHELLVALNAREMHPKVNSLNCAIYFIKLSFSSIYSIILFLYLFQFLDIDSIILENKYLNERLKNIENEVELTKHSLSKYKVRYVKALPSFKIKTKQLL